MPLAQINLPPRQRVAVAAKRQLHGARVKAVVLHPGCHRLDEILQRRGQAPRGKYIPLAGLEQAVAKLRDKPLADSPDAFARLLWRELAPLLVFGAQLAMKLRQHFVLKTALLARVRFEKFPLLGAQAGMNEKLERTGAELFQRAHRGAQHRAVKQL